MKTPVFHPGAEIEYQEAALHYAGILPALGVRFYEEIERLIAEACRNPGTFRFIREPVRRHFSREFPYGILYVEQPDHIWILAVMPLHREPGYWRQRLRR